MYACGVFKISNSIYMDGWNIDTGPLMLTYVHEQNAWILLASGDEVQRMATEHKPGSTCSDSTEFPYTNMPGVFWF